MANDFQPGDRLLDRFVPAATDEARVRARDAFLDYGRRLLALADTLPPMATDGDTHLNQLGSDGKMNTNPGL